MRLGICALLLWASGFGGFGATGPTNQVVQILGRVSPQTGGGTNLVFMTEPGERLTLIRTPQSEALFLDTNLWSRVLLLTGKEGRKSFEVTGKLHSIKDGKVYEIFYYCDVCSISSSIPGLCQCCREPTVLTEKAER